MGQIARIIIISILAGVIGISLMWFSISFFENMRVVIAARKLRKKAAAEEAQIEGDGGKDEGEGEGDYREEGQLL